MLPKLSVDSGHGNPVRDMWDRLQGVPGGKYLFSRFVGIVAPYTATVHARVETLEDGRSVVTMRDRPGLRNPFRSVHAVALTNLAELTGNLAVSYGLADDARFIVSGFDMEFHAKARGLITGRCEVDVPKTNDKCLIPVEVGLYDDSGQRVATAILRTAIGPKKGQVSGA